MIINLADKDFSTPQHSGNKAYNLNKLSKLGYNICGGYVLTAGFFWKFCYYNKIELTSENIVEEIYRGYFDKHSELVLNTIYENVIKRTGAVIVRSSSPEEDSCEKSCAGIYESVLDVKEFVDMLRAVKRVWYSYFSETALEYNKNQRQYAMPVIIQEMLYCDKSGVMFTKNPLNNRDKVIIESCEGNNDKIMDNRAKAEKYILSGSEKRKLINLAHNIETDMEYPCDIEWGIKGKKIYVFQARPIVRQYDEDIYTKAGDNPSLDCILLDRYAKPASACYLSLLDDWQNRVYLSYYSKKQGEVYDEKPLCFLNNRVYWNVKYQKKYFEDEGKNSIVKRVLLHFLIRRGYKSWYKRLPWYDENIKILTRRVYKTNNYNKLVNILDSTIYNFCDYLGVDHFRFLGLAQILYNRLNNLSYKNKEEREELLRLVSKGTNKNETVKANSELLYIARIIRADRELCRLFLERSEEEILHILYENKEYVNVKECLDDFVLRHGHRGVDCDDLYYPHWNEDPSQIVLLIKQLLKSETPLFEGEQQEGTIKNRKLKRLAHLTGEYMCLRENQRYYFDKSWDLLRNIILKLSGYYMEKGIITNKQDIFHMTIDEIKEGIKYKNYTINKSVIDRRKENYQKQIAKTPPYMMKNAEEVPVQKSGRCKSYKVMGISAGIAEGKIKIINSLEDIGNIEANDIGVVKTFHPSWTPILKIVSGLIMNYGNMLSHGAVVAREYKIPVVVFNGDATKVFRDGDKVSINGTNGRIKMLKEDT